MVDLDEFLPHRLMTYIEDKQSKRYFMRYNKTVTNSNESNVLEAFFKDMVSYGKIGASRKLIVYVDGDGAVHPEITREDKQLASESEYGCGKTSKECEFWNPNPREDNFTYREDLTIYYDLG